MDNHPWLQSLEIVAICPKCDAPALKRSHSNSKFEKHKKKLTLKRLFRCHECGWRGWIFETSLRYPVTGDVQPKIQDGIINNEIPAWDLDDSHAEDDSSKAQQTENELTQHPETGIKPSDLCVQSRDRDQVGNDVKESSPDADIELRGENNQNSKSSKVEEKFEDGLEGEPPPFDSAVSHIIPDELRSFSRLSGRLCPKCGVYSLHRSRPRNVLEFLLKKAGKKRIYRCHKCGWRGWLSKNL